MPDEKPIAQTPAAGAERSSLSVDSIRDTFIVAPTGTTACKGFTFADDDWAGPQATYSHFMRCFADDAAGPSVLCPNTLCFADDRSGRSFIAWPRPGTL